LLKGAQCRPVRNIHSGKFERSTGIVAVSGIKLGCMVGECKQVPGKKASHTSYFAGKMAITLTPRMSTLMQSGPFD